MSAHGATRILGRVKDDVSWAYENSAVQKELRWQLCHATKILHLGLIPLTDEERNAYSNLPRR